MLDEVLARLYLSTDQQDGIVPYLLKQTKYSTSNLKMGNFVTPFDTLIATATFGHAVDDLFSCTPQGDSVYNLFSDTLKLISDEDYLNYMRKILQLLEDQMCSYLCFLNSSETEMMVMFHTTGIGQRSGISAHHQIQTYFELCTSIQLRVHDMLELLGERHAQVIYDALILDEPELFEGPNLLFPVN